MNTTLTSAFSYGSADADIGLQLPCGIWPEHPKLKELGRYQLEQACEALEAYCMASFTRIRGWSKEECQILVANAKKELRNPENHLYSKVHFVYGREPEAPKTEEA